MTKKAEIFAMFFISILTCLCVSTISIFFSICNPNRLYTSSATISSSPFSVYFISTNKSLVEIEAIALGKDSMANGHAGYVWEKEGYFYVISSGYQNENDATLVKNTLKAKGMSAEIINIDFESLKLPYSFSQSEKEVMSSTIKIFREIYSYLYDISICLDTEVYNETNAIIEINKLLSLISGTEKNYQSLFSENEDETIKNIGEYLADILESISQLSDKSFITPSQSLSSLVKYKYCEVLHIYQNLLIELK